MNTRQDPFVRNTTRERLQQEMVPNKFVIVQRNVLLDVHLQHVELECPGDIVGITEIKIGEIHPSKKQSLVSGFFRVVVVYLLGSVRDRDAIGICNRIDFVPSDFTNTSPLLDENQIISLQEFNKSFNVFCFFF